MLPPLHSNPFHENSGTGSRCYRKLNTVWFLWEKGSSISLQWKKRKFSTPPCSLLGHGKAQRLDYLSPTSWGQTDLWRTSSLSNKSHLSILSSVRKKVSCQIGGNLWVVWKPLDCKLLPLLDTTAFLALVLVSLFQRERIIFLSDVNGIFSVQDYKMQGGTWWVKNPPLTGKDASFVCDRNFWIIFIICQIN